jgi:hypothetical protein
MKRQTKCTALAVLLTVLLGGVFSVSAEDRTETDRGRFGTKDEVAAAPVDTGFDRWLYLGLRIGPSVRIYTPEEDIPYTGGDTAAFSMDMALQASLLALPYLSIQAEVVWSWDDLSLREYTPGPNPGTYVNSSREFTSFSFRFPLLLRLNFYPGMFRVSPFFGFYCIAPLGKLTVDDDQGRRKESWKTSPPVGLTGGISVGRKTGPGILFADLRWDIDLGELELGGDRVYRRSMISLSLGYEFGFFSKKGGN